MKPEALEERRRALEESFFKDHNARLRDAIRAKAATGRKRTALSQSSGLTDPILLNLLLELEIDSETLAALTLIPLVEIAWADGSVADREQKAILEAAASIGIDPESESHLLLRNWLKEPPTPRLLEAWEAYVAALSETLTAEARETLRDDVIGRATGVARAAGGFLGLGRKISASELKVIDRLEQAFFSEGGEKVAE